MSWQSDGRKLKVIINKKGRAFVVLLFKEPTRIIHASS